MNFAILQLPTKVYKILGVPYSTKFKARREGIDWVEPLTTTKHMDYPYSPHQRKFCTEGLLGRHALGVLGRTLVWPICAISNIPRKFSL